MKGEAAGVLQGPQRLLLCLLTRIVHSARDGRREISGNVYFVRLYILHVIYIEDK